jgi:pyocin large subunit-like protein
VGFRSPDKLDEHFAKHGSEFGHVSKAEYLQLAQRLRDAAPGGDILELIRPSDGVVSRFDKLTGAFLAYDRDGTIRTFFKPNDGERYFRRQARRPG